MKNALYLIMAIVTLASCSREEKEDPKPTTSIEGYVKAFDEFGAKELPDDNEGITVELEGTSYKASTDENGKFTISGVEEGRYLIVLKKEGFALAKRELVISTVGGNQPIRQYFGIQEKSKTTFGRIESEVLKDSSYGYVQDMIFITVSGIGKYDSLYSRAVAVYTGKTQDVSYQKYDRGISNINWSRYFTLNYPYSDAYRGKDWVIIRLSLNEIKTNLQLNKNDKVYIKLYGASTSVYTYKHPFELVTTYIDPATSLIVTEDLNTKEYDIIEASIP